jgi:hypothetical protein
VAASAAEDLTTELEEWTGNNMFAVPERMHEIVDRLAESVAFCREEPERTGCLARLVTGQPYSVLSNLVIFVNTATIIYDANRRIETSSDSPEIVAAESIFLVWYVSEVLLKLFVHRLFFFTNHDAAFNCLDFILVVLGMFEVIASLLGSDGFGNAAFLRVLRIFKVAKVFRMFRALRLFSEIRVMMDCVTTSLSPLSWAAVLLAFLSCVFGVFFVQQVGGALEADTLTPDQAHHLVESFGSVEMAMFSLLEATTGGNDWHFFYTRLSPLGVLVCGAFLFYILFMQIAVMNIVMAVFLDKALNCAKPTVESMMLDKHYQDIEDAKELTALVSEMDSHHTGVITFSDFCRYMHNEKFRLYFDVRGLSVKDTSMFFQMLASASNGGSEDRQQEEDSVDLQAFVTGCMRLKGTASCMDLYTLSQQVKAMRADQLERSETLSRFVAWAEAQFARPNSPGSGMAHV